SYGRYVVLVHDSHQPVHYSLYSHLRSIQPGLEIGSQVAAGETIGIMGRSAGGYTIPRERAHLHFEIGFWLSDQFQTWYDRQDFGSPNRHGNFNGMNLVGIDPLAYLEARRDGRQGSLQAFLHSLPVGFIVQVRSAYIPHLVRRNPQLLTRQLPSDGVQGWEVEFTAYGFPLRFTPLDATAAERMGPPGAVVITAVSPEEIRTFACRRMVQLQGAQARPGDGFRRIVQLLFDLK
ncbi:MAG: M23 family metallopeptidase, partial [Verrucomicrobia bacterium]|nr:M23 family metallopeptidase [Verrucomicrobiota bacterium]